MKNQNDVILEIKNLNKKYDERYVLKNVNWIVRRGEFWALIGENGSGKTTLSKIIIGLIKDFKGVVKRNGKIIYLPQHLRKQMLPFTVSEIVKLFNISKDLIEYFELGEHMDKSLDELSGGLFQALFISLILSVEADLYILDEPTTNLDKKKEKALYKKLMEFVNKGKSIILITHDVGFVKDNVEHIACIHKGDEGLNFHCALDEESIIRHGGMVKHV